MGPINKQISPTLVRILISGGSCAPLVTIPGSMTTPMTTPTNKVDADPLGWT
jgi:hypothetical protein